MTINVQMNFQLNIFRKLEKGALRAQRSPRRKILMLLLIVSKSLFSKLHGWFYSVNDNLPVSSPKQS